MERKSLDQFLKEGNVAMYGYQGPTPDFAQEQRIGRFRMFVRGGGPGVLPYARLQEMRDERADVYFLDHEAEKVMLADFPATSHYVLIRTTPRLSWFVAIPGLMRRLRLGLLKYEGVVTLPAGESTTRWYAYRHVLTESLHTRLSLSTEVGVLGLFTFLKTERVNYVVQRFFSDLPSLGRAGGDLDLMISDDDEVKVKSFLQAHPGTITVDAWTVSRKSFNDITYYPPPLARKMLESKISGPAESLVPAPHEALHSFIYHVLYHKGLFAGVPSTLMPESVNKTPENDYGGEILRLARSAGVELTLTMEALDEYLASVGWQPKLDTLAKIAPRNPWVWRRFFEARDDTELGLGVFIIKARAKEDGSLEKMLDALRREPGFAVLREKLFTKDEVARVSTELRGGVWHGEAGSGDLSPAAAVLVVDEVVLREANAGTAHGAFVERIRTLKKRLRKTYDTRPGSSIHATDNTSETWDYITHCFPGEEPAIRSELAERRAKLKVPLVERLRLWAKHLPRLLTYHSARAKRRLKEWVLGLILR